MTELRHKTFIGPTIYWQGGTLNENREAIRAEAEAFVNRIGLQNVVSICEHAMTLGPFSVVVWYRAEASIETGSPVVQVSNAAIARRLGAGPLYPAAPAPKNEAGTGPVVGWLVWLIVLLTAIAAVAFFWQE
jgi:hypothetical protein